ncbi:MAG TPA: hypothetical protein VNJ31_05010 [Methyloceanibacter sp.]|nr:hypothetical protein [Methyloceanibacter sp.]
MQGERGNAVLWVGSMYASGRLRGARVIVLTLIAGLAAFEVALAFGARVVGIPGVFLYRLAAGSGDAPSGPAASYGGEITVAKLTPKPVAVLAEEPQGAAVPAGEPRLNGLMDIPLQDLDAAKDADAQRNPDARTPLGKAFGAGAKAAHSDLPWEDVEPVPFGPAEQATADATSALPNRGQPDVPPAPLQPTALAALPSNAAVQGWVKAKAMEIKGADRSRALYHFEYWLDAPEDVKARLAAVAYEFNTPAVRPQQQVSSERRSGFRISAGGLTCADNVKVTLTFVDGRTQEVDVDGCKLLS